MQTVTRPYTMPPNWRPTFLALGDRVNPTGVKFPQLQRADHVVFAAGRGQELAIRRNGDGVHWDVVRSPDVFQTARRRSSPGSSTLHDHSDAVYAVGAGPEERARQRLSDAVTVDGTAA